MTGEFQGRVWSNAPAAVRSVRALNIFAMVIEALLVVAMVGTGAAMHPEGMLVTLAYVAFFALQSWLIGAFRRGVPVAWRVQLVVAILGLIGFPIGTLVNGLILYYWLKPDTKAWFNV